MSLFYAFMEGDDINDSSSEKIRNFLHSQKNQINIFLKSKKFLSNPEDRTIKSVPISMWENNDSLDMHSEWSTWDVETFLNDPNENRKIIAAPYGLGKSVIVNQISLKYTELAIESHESSNKIKVLPILIPVNRIHDVWERLGDKSYMEERINNFEDYRIRKTEPESRGDIKASLRLMLDRIKSKTLLDLKTIENSNIETLLLIIDGINHYSVKEISEQITYLNNQLSENRNFKVKMIITTRKEIHLKTALDIDEQYTELFPFDEPQITQYIEKYHSGIVTYKPKLTLVKVEKEFKLEKEMHKPLFCFLITQEYYEGQFAGQILEWNPVDAKTWIFLNFKSDLKKEKPILRKIAVLKKRDKDITHENILDQFTLLNWDKQDIDIDKIQTLSSYFLTHEILIDYLLAEYYLECLAKNEIDSINIGIPSRETVEFIDGLISIISCRLFENKFDDADILSKIIHDTEINHFKQFVTNIMNSINMPNYPYKDTDILHDSIVNKKQKYLNTNLSIHNTADYSIQRWIAYYVAHKWNLIENPGEPVSPFDLTSTQTKTRLSFMIRRLSSHIPKYLKDFEKLDLSDTDLSGADMSESNITGTIFHECNLHNVDLSSSYTNDPKQETKFHRALMFHTDLEDLKVPKINCSNAFLWQCDLSGADISESLFHNAKMHFVKINNRTNILKTQFNKMGIVDTPFLDDVNKPEIITSLDKQRAARSDGEYFRELSGKISQLEGVRHSSVIIHHNSEILYSNFNKKIGKPLITTKDKIILINYALPNWERLTKIEEILGKLRSFVIDYAELKIIMIKLPTDLIMLITTEPSTDANSIITSVVNNIENCKKRVELKDINCIKRLITKKEDFPSGLNPLGICKKIKERHNEIFHYVKIFDSDNEIAKIIERNDNEVTREIVSDIRTRWKYRQTLTSKIGKIKYAITDYSSGSLLSTWINNEQQLLILGVDRPHTRKIKLHENLLRDVVAITSQTNPHYQS